MASEISRVGNAGALRLGWNAISGLDASKREPGGDREPCACPGGGLQERFARKNETADLKRAFEVLDGDKDGKVDAEELAAYFAAAGHRIKKASAAVGWEASG